MYALGYIASATKSSTQLATDVQQVVNSPKSKQNLIVSIERAVGYIYLFHT